MKNYAVLDKSLRTLNKEHKELQKKNDKTLLELKTLRNDNGTVDKHNSSPSVAVKSCKKEAESSVKFKEIYTCNAELEKLIKSVTEAETREAKNAEKNRKGFPLYLSFQGFKEWFPK